MIAIIETGGKQYLVTAQSKLSIEKIVGEPNGKIDFTDVLLRANEDGSKLEIGTPLLATPVVGTVVRQYRARKVIVRKFKSKVRYHRTAGHRQNLTEILINKIA